MTKESVASQVANAVVGAINQGTDPTVDEIRDAVLYILSDLDVGPKNPKASSEPTEFKFTLSVQGARSQSLAELAVLSAFSLRNPDGMMFDLKPYHENRT